MNISTLLLAALFAVKAPSPPPPPTDTFLHGNETITLQRSETEVAIALKRGRHDVALPPKAKAEREIVASGRVFRLVSTEHRESLGSVVSELRANDAVESVAGVFFHEQSQTRMLATDEVVVQLRPGATRRALLETATSAGMTVDRAVRGAPDEFVLRIAEANGDALEKARLLRDRDVIAWAEPHFIRQYRKLALPNDPRFAQQWHFQNTGQNFGVPGADVKAVAGWDLHTGSPQTVIAIVDDGVEKSHPDLMDNIFTNPGEIDGNGIDDDHNGYVDDVHGWDFSNDDNDADPSSDQDNHGTAMAGIAAARGNNALGVTGTCHSCTILPVKIFSPDYAGDVVVAEALRYAASLADVASNSWGGGPPSAAIHAALQSASAGRGGKGTPMFFGAGNRATGLQTIEVPIPTSGTHRFRFTYIKDDSLSAGDDSMWIAWVRRGTQLLTFWAPFPPAGGEWQQSGGWNLYSDVAFGDSGVHNPNFVKAPPVAHGGSTWIQYTSSLFTPGTFTASVWVSSEKDYDGLIFQADYGNDGTYDLTLPLISGVPQLVYGVDYPGAYPEAIAVGASTSFDCRAAYSQTGTVDFVAPAGGASAAAPGLETTDRSGAAGYDAGDYTSASTGSAVSGTSAAAALASGIAGLMLSKNPSATAGSVTSAMQSTAESMYPYWYRPNPDSGFGRVNMARALQTIGACDAIEVQPATLPDATKGTAYSASLSAAGGSLTHTWSISLGELPPGLALDPSTGEISGTPTAEGTFTFSVQALSTASPCSGHRTYNLLVEPGANPSGTSLYILTPCRVIDTRKPAFAPALPHLGTRDVQVSGVCGVPETAKSVAAIITAVGPTAVKGFLALYPTGTTWAGTSTMSYRSGKTRANNAIVTLSASGQTTVLNNGAAQHFIIDVTGYFQ